LVLKAVRVEGSSGELATFAEGANARVTQPDRELWADASGAYQLRFHPSSPQGGETLEKIETDICVTAKPSFMTWPVSPVGIGEFPDLRYQGQRIGIPCRGG